MCYYFLPDRRPNYLYYVSFQLSHIICNYAHFIFLLPGDVNVGKSCYFFVFANNVGTLSSNTNQSCHRHEEWSSRDAEAWVAGSSAHIPGPTGKLSMCLRSESEYLIQPATGNQSTNMKPASQSKRISVGTFT